MLDVLRREGRPVALPEVARRVVQLRGLDPSSGAVLAAIEGSAGRALRHQRRAGECRVAVEYGKPRERCLMNGAEERERTLRLAAGETR